MSFDSEYCECTELYGVKIPYRVKKENCPICSVPTRSRQSFFDRLAEYHNSLGYADEVDLEELPFPPKEEPHED